MKIRRSRLRGRLEHEVEDFVATLEKEFDFDVNCVVVLYSDELGEEQIHTFHLVEECSSYDEIEV